MSGSYRSSYRSPCLLRFSATAAWYLLAIHVMTGSNIFITARPAIAQTKPVCFSVPGLLCSPKRSLLHNLWGVAHSNRAKPVPYFMRISSLMRH